MNKKSFDTSSITNILLITLSNVGDIVLTFPVLDQLLAAFPQAGLSVVVGPKGESFFRGHPAVRETIVFNKRQPTAKTIAMVWALRKGRYQLTVDLRNTAIPFLIGSKFRTSLAGKTNRNEHMTSKHLARLSTVMNGPSVDVEKKALFVSKEDEAYVQRTLSDAGYRQRDLVIIAPGSANERKRWHTAGFAEVADGLIDRFGVGVVLAGDAADGVFAEEIQAKMRGVALNLCGKTSLPQLAGVIRAGSLALMNDSAPMHIASYLDIPVLALFGASNPLQYGPWGRMSHYIQSPSAGDINGISPAQVFNSITKTDKGFNFNR